MTALLLLFACSSEPPPPPVDAIDSAEAGAAAATLLCEAAAQAGASDCVAEGASVTVSGHTLEVPVDVTGFMAFDSRSIGMGSNAQKVPGEVQLAADVSLSVDGAELMGKSYTHAVSGLDLEVARAEVLDELLQRWMVGYGLAALDAVIGGEASALASVGMEVAPVRVGGARVYAAYPMVSGVGLDPRTGGRMGPQVGSMAAALGPYIKGLSPGLHSVWITADLGGPGGPGRCGLLPPVAPGSDVSMVRLDGEVKVDGKAGADLCAISEDVAWPLPKGEDTITWEQFFVVRAGAGAEGEGDAEGDEAGEP